MRTAVVSAYRPPAFIRHSGRPIVDQQSAAGTCDATAWLKGPGSPLEATLSREPGQEAGRNDLHPASRPNPGRARPRRTGHRSLVPRSRSVTPTTAPPRIGSPSPSGQELPTLDLRIVRLVGRLYGRDLHSRRIPGIQGEGVRVLHRTVLPHRSDRKSFQFTGSVTKTSHASDRARKPSSASWIETAMVRGGSQCPTGGSRRSRTAFEYRAPWR